MSPLKGSIRFGQNGKLSPRFIESFEISQKVGLVAYRLALPPSLQGIHDVFHVSSLRKYVPDPNHVIQYEPRQVKENLTYVEEPIRILEKTEKKLRNRSISYVKVLWKHYKVAEATWELESEMREKYPVLFQSGKQFRGWNSFRVESVRAALSFYCWLTVSVAKFMKLCLNYFSTRILRQLCAFLTINFTKKGNNMINVITDVTYL